MLFTRLGRWALGFFDTVLNAQGTDHMSMRIYSSMLTQEAHLGKSLAGAWLPGWTEIRTPPCTPCTRRVHARHTHQTY